MRRVSPIHRISTRSTLSGGVRWSSYVGDVRCADNLSKSRCAAANARAEPLERLLVLGSGAAGCAAALAAARLGVPSTVLHAGSRREDCNSYWAQGGIIYRNYRLREAGGGGRLADTSLSLVEDVRRASGYEGALRRSAALEEGPYGARLALDGSGVLGRKCPKTNIWWNEDAAWKLACEGPSRVRELLLGKRDGGMNCESNAQERVGCIVPFDRVADGDGELDVLSLCLEASHAAPRIIHHADCTGKAITTHITRAAANHPLIEFVGDSIATDLLHGNDSAGGDDALVIGARVLDKRTNTLSDYYATRGVVLASGGLAGIYQHSTNPSGFNALGSSVALALRLEREIRGSDGGGIAADLEYVQFHPTALFVPNEARFLLTEALRGEGAVLRDADGRAFARDYHPDGELAPRDVVARAVYAEARKGGGGAGDHNAFLDITHRDADWLRGRFPSVHAHLSSRSVPIDLARERVPVVPAAHYACGGVATDLDGRAVGSRGGRYRNLFAAGEAARTGLHGGNRLASTSLLEGLVFGSSVGEAAAGAGASSGAAEEATESAEEARRAIELRLARGRASNSGGTRGAGYDAPASREAAEGLALLKSLMWENVGVVRDPSKLSKAVSELSAIRDRADRLWAEASANGRATSEIAALRDAAYAGLAVAESALSNRVSGGAHYIAPENADDFGSDGESSDEGSDGEEEEALVAVARG